MAVTNKVYLAYCMIFLEVITILKTLFNIVEDRLIFF